MKNIKILLLIISSLLCSTLAGCASITGGTKQNISVTTTPVTGVQCTLSNDVGKWYGTTPCSILVHRSDKPLFIYCHKPGYQDVNTQVPSKTKMAVAGNILFGGIAGICIDTADGAAFRYASTIQIPMKKQY